MPDNVQDVPRIDGGAAVSEHVGSFRYWFDDGRWEWSDEVAAMHGYGPGEVVPTTELLRSHKHPDDRAGFDALVAQMRAARVQFSSRHRIVDTAGAVHSVVVISRTFQGLDGRAAGSEGFYLDLGVLCEDDDADQGGEPHDDAPQAGAERRDEELFDEQVQDKVTEQVQEFRESSAIIEQAKGMLMLMYGISAERAFDVLRWRSQQENRKLREVCAGLIRTVAVHTQLPEQVRHEFDLLLLNPFDV